MPGTAVRTDLFRSGLSRRRFLRMWSEGRRKKLEKHTGRYDAVTVLGCEIAYVTVRDVIRSTRGRSAMARPA